MPALLNSLNGLAVLAVSGVLGYALFDQFVFGELPCPLCLLQRVGFVLVGLGFALNVVLGTRSSHYGLVIFGALAGAAVSARQVALHIVPGSGSYGEALFGLHFYTWALIAFALVIAGTAFLLLFDRQFRSEPEHTPNWRRVPALGKVAVIVLGVVIAINALSTAAECGVGFCPDNPTSYELFGSR